MKIKPSVLISAAIAVVSFFVFIGFRTIPVSRLWKGYQILYVYSNDLGEQDILGILYKNGCENVISLANQQFPIVSPVTPIQAQKSDSYIFRRNAFFTDRSNTARVFYVPDAYSKALEKSIFEISAFAGSSCGTDGKSSFPWIAPILAILFVLLLLYFSKQKSLFLSAASFPVLFAFCRPMYTVAAGVLFLIFAFHLLSGIWKRKGFVKIFLNSPYTIIFAVSPLLLLVFSSLSNAFFYLLCIASSVSALVLYSEKEEKTLERCSFKPVFIRSSKMIPLVGYRGIRLMGALCGTLLVLAFIFVLFGRISGVGNNASRPSLPSPVKSSAAELADFSDMIEWSWNTITFPYRRAGINSEKKASEGDIVLIPDYAEENGHISAYESQMYVFDSKFKDSVIRKIENLDYPALEKMMLRQGKGASYGYSKGSLSSSERFGFLLLGIFLLISTAMAAYYIIGRKRYGLSV